MRVQPDILPQGSIRIDNVLMDGKPYGDFDAAALTINLPESEQPLQVEVRVVPT